MLQALFLLVIANCFMTLAWYGHLKFLPHDAPLWQAILFSWIIALFEYSLMIPATKLLAQQGLAVGQMKMAVTTTTPLFLFQFLRIQ